MSGQESYDERLIEMTAVNLEAGDWQRLLTAATGGPILDPSHEQDGRIEKALQAAIPPDAPPPTEPPATPPPTKVEIALSADKGGVIVKALPAGAVAADFARMKDQTGTGTLYGPKGIKVGGEVKGTTELPVLDAQAVDAGDHPVPPLPADPWAGRVVTTPAGGSTTPPPPTEPPTTPPPTTSGILYGVNSGGEAADLAACKTLGAKAVRIEVGASHVTSILSEIEKYRAAGIKVILIAGFSGGMITPAQGKEVIKFAIEHKDVIVAIELGNETSYGYQYNDGVSAASYKERARNYAHRAQEMGPELIAHGIGLFAQADDGGSGSSVWVDEMYSAVPELHKYVSQWVNHTYGPKGVTKLENTIRFLAKHGDNKTPFALTEDGISTDDGRPLSDNYGYPTNLDYAQAANLYGAHVATIRRVGAGRVRTFMYYQDRDQKPHGTDTDREHYFGALTREGNAKGALTMTVKNLLAS